MNTPKSTKKFIAYYRVSTTKQGESGLGLEAQRLAVQAYLKTTPEAEIFGEFTEVESGKKKNRPELEKALKLCKRQKATLIIAKLDRLARNVHFISGLMESQIEFVACDNPQANKFMVHMLSAFAEHEREMISQRTKEGLKVAKARGVILGANGKALAEKNRQTADRHALAILDAIRTIPEDLRGNIASLTREMNRHQIPTMKKGKWHRQSVYNLLSRYNNLGFEL